MGVFPGHPLHITARRFARSTSGALAPILAFALPSILGLVGGAADYASIAHQKSQIAAIADSAALGVAREMSMARLSDAQAQSSAETYVKSNAHGKGLAELAVRAKPSKDQLAVDLTLTGKATLPVGILKFSGLIGNLELEASARARLQQQTKLCLLSIAEARTDARWTGGLKSIKSDEKTGVHLQTDSRITANGCVLHTNIAGKDAFRIDSGAEVNADLICAVGGVNNSGGRIMAQVLNDCPAVRNPLDRKPTGLADTVCLPGTNAGTYLKSGHHVLSAGSYCGEVIISGNAKVTLQPGVYRFSGPLIVKENAELVGNKVGFYFWTKLIPGEKLKTSAYFRFQDNALIDISAPENGPMAGMLVWESINSSANELTAKLVGANYHQISSSRAKRLNGTIYLPMGRLLINAPHRMAEESDYTVLLVNRLDLANGPNLVLNSNYAKSRVPVPEGLGPIGAKFIRLEK